MIDVRLERANIYSSYAEYQLRDDEYRFKIEGKNHVEQNLNSEARGTLDQDVFNISKSAAFDYSRTEAKVSLIAFTKSSWLQPFVIGDLADISYFNQSTGASIDRNADEHYGIAGVRLKFDESFRIDVGARHNMRDFEDTTFDKFDSTWFDVNVYWQPTEAFKVTAIAERFIDEPSSSFGLADDVRTTGLTVDWKFMPLWKLSTAAFYDRIEAIGDDFINNKYVTTMSLTYEPSDHVQYFLSGLGKWVKEDVSGESYERYKIGAGVRYTF